MATPRHQIIEQELLRLTLDHGDSDGQGYGASLPILKPLVQPLVQDLTDRDLTDALIRLDRDEHLAILKWIPGRGFVRFRVSGMTTPVEFFNQGDFRLQPTPDTDPYLAQITALTRTDQKAVKTSWMNSTILPQPELYEQLDALGLDYVKQGLTTGYFSSRDCKRVMEWILMKAKEAVLPPKKHTHSGEASSFIAVSRIEELRQISSPDFDFQKLVRLWEELNSSFEHGNYYATAMLTRGIIDHIPPLFDSHKTFAGVANNYSGGGKSFKEAMQHLDGLARKVGDGHLHMHIRKSETLPTMQQVSCAQQIDLLLSEIIRIMK